MGFLDWAAGLISPAERIIHEQTTYNGTEWLRNQGHEKQRLIEWTIKYGKIGTLYVSI